MDGDKGRMESEEPGTGRLEAFSDGVFAIAVTLLVLDIHVPGAGGLPAGKRLGDVLLDQWPQYLAYVTSFLTILIMWVNHHNILRRIGRADHAFLFLNGLLLMGITVVPFPTALLAEWFQRSEADARTAAAIYCGLFVLIALLFNLLWRYAVWNGRLLHRRTDERFVRVLSRQYLFGPPVYLAAFLLAFVSVAASVTVVLGLALFFALPLGSERRGPAPSLESVEQVE